MNLKAISTALLATTSTLSHAETLFLNCDLVKNSSVTIAQLYNPVPKSARDISTKYLYDGIMLGLGNYLSIPPSTWKIDTTSRVINSPEEQISFSNADINDSRIRATAMGIEYDLNRISGTLKYTISVSESTIAEWKKLHGGTLPKTNKYLFKCTSANRSAI